MRVEPYRLPDSHLIVPNLEHFFGDVRNRENCLEIVGQFSFKDIAEIYLIRLGAIGIRFLDTGPLQSILRLRTQGSGMVPDHVTQNHDDVTALQERRMVFVNFIAGALFGKLAGLRRTALSGAQYAGMDEILIFAVSNGELVLEHSRHTQAIVGSKTRFATEEPDLIRIVTPDELNEAVAFFSHIAEREDEFEFADLRACMLMNYQAAILHRDQQSAASLALNFSVAEALVEEIFLAYGIVGDRDPKAFAQRDHAVSRISNRTFSNWRMGHRISALFDGALIEWNLHNRLDEARRLRNDLMHNAAAVGVTQSGTMQSAVRDLWSYLIDGPFELASGWSMRI